jgi:hypothetical protein
MKRALGYVVVVMLAAMASAQVFAQANPLLGTWKLNVAKSKYTGTPMPKEIHLRRDCGRRQFYFVWFYREV